MLGSDIAEVVVLQADTGLLCSPPLRSRDEGARNALFTLELVSCIDYCLRMPTSVYADS